MLLVVAPASALAMHDSGVFELDGDSVPTSHDDFDTIFSGPGGSYDHTFVDDSAEPDPSHHEPSNKDEQPVSQWGCVIKPNVSNKDDIRFAYTASYAVGSEGREFFGVNRDSNNGDANVGFWFFQQQVSCDPATAKFVGHKVDGDLFVVSAFTGGGNIPEVAVYLWTDPDGVVENGDEFLGDGVAAGVPFLVGNDCRAQPDPPGHHATTPYVCATVNGVSTNLAWESAPVEANKFFEGGINLSALVPDTCFLSYLAETRSSQSLTANLFDLVGGRLHNCSSITVDKVTTPAGSPQRFDFTVAGGPTPISDSFQLTDAAAPHETQAARPGSYAVTESLPAGWALTGATCVGGPFGAGAPYSNGAPFTLGVGHSVTCTFFNLGAVCGNGVVEGSEFCDDGNTTSGDCCSSTCGFEPTTVQCRPAAGACDFAELCTGSSAACPADAKSTAVCRAAAGECDVAESCDGTNNDCPANGFKGNGTSCTDDGNVCTTDTCQAGACAHPAGNAGTVCRASAGTCDVAETCTGSSTACPAEGFASSATTCRASAGTCDVAETCTGTSVACPADGLAPGGTVCRTSIGQCDVAETCTGSSVFCPADVKAPDGTVCSDADVCTVNDQCVSGQCAGAGPVCGNGTLDCGEACDDGNTAGSDGCSATCEVETGETCTNFTDDDGDGLVDCADSQCVCQAIVNVCVHACLSKILFKPKLDLVQVQGAVNPLTPVDPATEPVSLLVSNANGVVFTASLPAGTLQRDRSGAWFFKNRAATTLGGFSHLRLYPDLTGGTGALRFVMKGWGDPSDATLATMTVQIVIGNDVFATTGVWTQLRKGWRTQLP